MTLDNLIGKQPKSVTLRPLRFNYCAYRITLEVIILTFRSKES